MSPGKGDWVGRGTEAAAPSWGACISREPGAGEGLSTCFPSLCFRVGAYQSRFVPFSLLSAVHSLKSSPGHPRSCRAERAKSMESSQGEQAGWRVSCGWQSPDLLPDSDSVKQPPQRARCSSGGQHGSGAPRCVCSWGLHEPLLASRDAWASLEYFMSFSL